MPEVERQGVRASLQSAALPASAPSAEVILSVLSKAGAVFFRWVPYEGLTLLSASPRGLLGYAREDLLHDPDVAARVLDPEFLRELERLGAGFYVVTGEAVCLTLPFIAKSGARVWMEARVVPEITDSGVISGFLGIVFEAPQPGPAPASA